MIHVPETFGRDPYFKKTIEFTFGRKTFCFDVAHDLFSTFEIDFGSQLLLKQLDLPASGRVLDVCCGYGALGLTVAGLSPAATVEMVDRDLLAIKYCKRNAEQNGISNVRIAGSVGYESVEGRDFSLIVCNVPGKAGDEAIEALIRQGRERLAVNGRMYFVVITALNHLIVELVRKGNLPLRELARRKRHAVYCLDAR
jgi:16S rRNA (guanine1207-N2)-methyltransferase